MRYVWALDGYVYVGGRRLPVVLAFVVGATLALSIAGAVSAQAGFPLVLGAALFPVAIWAGQAWRLVTWVFFETEPLGLIFNCLVIFWLGTDLVQSWGSRRFLAIYLAFAGACAAVICLLALYPWPALMGARYAGATPLTAALVVAWAVLFPHRQILVYFVFPLGGRNLLYLTLGLTVLFGLFHGPAQVLPEFLTEALMLAYVREPIVYGLWLRLRLLGFRWKPRKAGHLRVVERDEPPRWLH